MAAALNLTRDGIAYHIKKMKSAELIERAGAKKGGAWKVLRRVRRPMRKWR